MTRRRTFLKQAALAGAGLAFVPPLLGAPSALGAPAVLTSRRTPLPTQQGTLVFRPHFVQQGRGPYLLNWAYASDTRWDAFRSDIAASPHGVTLSDTGGHQRFGIDVKWYVEDFGYLFMTADNAGEFYTLPPDGQTQELNLNYELARSRVARNRRRLAAHAAHGYAPSREVRGHLDLAEGYLEDAMRMQGDEARRGALAQTALLYALRGGELLEVDHANQVIARSAPRPDFYLGCDARAFYQMRTPEVFMDLFTDVFNFAALTYVWTHDGVIGDFERAEGDYNFEFRDAIVRRMQRHDIPVWGRPVLWFHTWVTPDWIKEKSFDELKRYTERHVRTMVGHYGDEVWGWEIVNEFHDWANDVELNPDQIVELTKFAFDVAADVNPRAARMVNNCCPYAEYVQLGQWSGWPNQPARYPQRTPWQFTRDLLDAGVDVTHIGQQMYFPERDLQDIIMLVERYETFNLPVHLSEVGAPGGPTERSVKLDTVRIPEGPYAWRRPWDEDTQADWIEGVYTLAYSKPWIEGSHWFDFVDPHFYIPSGGIIRTPNGEPKEGYHRLQALQRRWGVGPARDSVPRSIDGSHGGVGSTGGSACPTC
jgi:endo-1,4-beta-xylanase